MIISTSGGLVYHARALRARLAQDVWKDTRSLASFCALQWLRQVQPTALYLMGPSCGYLMNRALLEGLSQFANRNPLLIAEPDPIARFVFRSRLPWTSQKHISFDEHFLLNWCAESTDPLRLQTSRPALLFWGCLGQLTDLKLAERRLQKNLSQPGLLWASLHDRYSLEHGPTKCRSNANRNFHDASGDVPQVILDHETSWISALSRATPIPIHWPLTRRRVHWMEWVTSA